MDTAGERGMWKRGRRQAVLEKREGEYEEGSKTILRNREK